MALVVGIHGIAQQGSNPGRQLKLWSDALRIGLSASGFGKEMPTFAAPYYGFLFRDGSAYLGDDDEPIRDPDELQFVADAIAEITESTDSSEPMASSGNLGPPAVIPPALLRGLASVDRRWGGGRSSLLIGNLRQVYAYLFRTGAGAVIREAVAHGIASDARVLVGHSLGSVVGFDILRRGLAGQITTFVTIGSPLPWRTIQTALATQHSGVLAPNVVWTNVFDPWDVVTAGRGLTPEAVDVEVDNGRADPHSLTRYLSQRVTARAILDGVETGHPGR
ncbi:hypothetical protein [Nocardia sp. GCM10030253]|uniref:hypothetical protein n=1 Tax=Nocardia sp. GCM10030253 TaxID=3273404 RepID=UPI003670D229